MGIIEHLEMHQFMCHKYLTFSFGPQINFIIGQCCSWSDQTWKLIALPQVTMEVSDEVLPHRLPCSSLLTYPSLGGKSAVLSALTVALGGKATSTGRGSGLKSFIREGQSYVIMKVR